MRKYAYVGGGSWDVQRAISYMDHMPRMNAWVEIDRVQREPKEVVSMAEALVLCVQADVGMSDADYAMLTTWIAKRHWPNKIR